MPSLLDRIVAALAEDAATEALNALNVEAGRPACHRRHKILYELQRYVNLNGPAMSATSTTHRFKKAFATAKFIDERDGKTRAITANNLTDEDVLLMQRNGGAHLLEQLPEADKPEVEDLHKLLKPALQTKYAEVVGEVAPESMLKEDLIKAIEAKQKA
jgi:predicted transcriptional regulator